MCPRWFRCGIRDWTYSFNYEIIGLARAPLIWALRGKGQRFAPTISDMQSILLVPLPSNTVLKQSNLTGLNRTEMARRYKGIWLRLTGRKWCCREARTVGLQKGVEGIYCHLLCTGSELYIHVGVNRHIALTGKSPKAYPSSLSCQSPGFQP